MTKTSSLLSGRLLADNIIWSLIASGLPLVVGLWAIPVLIDGLGKERFGLLTIIWMGIGYFSIFDLGLGRALTKLIAERLGNGQHESLPHLTSLGLRLIAGFGILAALVLAAVTPALVRGVLKIPEALIDEAKWSFWILAGTLPFVVSTAGLIGVLQAHQRFRAIALIRIPFGLANFLGPILVLPLTRSLVGTTFALAAARLFAWLAYLFIGRRSGVLKPSVSEPHERSLAKQLLSFGGWITVSNVISPLMTYFDRFFIGSMLGLMAVTYYTTPYEIIIRLWIIPDAVANVIFPAMATSLVARIARTREIYDAARAAHMLLLFPIIAVLTLFAREGLELWLDPEFAANSTEVLRWLALGVYINANARFPFALLMSKGRPDIIAKLHIFELPLYAAALWYLTGAFGIIGAAVAWTGRMILDSLLLFLSAAWQTPELKMQQYRGLSWVAISSLALIGIWLVDIGTAPGKLLALIPIGVMMLMMSMDVRQRTKLHLLFGS